MAECGTLKDARWNIKKEDLMFEPVQEKSLGVGSFGEVFNAKWLGNKVAAKRLHKRVYTEGGDASKSVKPVEYFHREYFLMTLIHHPHVVQLYGVYVPDDQSDAPPVIIMELLDKTLREVIVKRPRLLLLEVIDYSLQITSALCYLHGLTPPIIHRDLTTNNIMLTSNGICKIVDLGLAKVFDRAAQRELTSRPGNACYMPVEVLNGIGQYDERLDVFSFNIVMLEMCNGRVSQPTRELLEERPGGGYTPISERKRREIDLSYLEDGHPLKGIILSLLAPQISLPAITEVHQQLQSLRQSNEVTRQSSEELQAMRRNFSEKEEAHQQEINELKETVLGAHGLMQDVLEVVTRNQVSLRQTRERVEEVSVSQRRTEDRLEGLSANLALTNAKLQEVSETQETIRGSLKTAQTSLSATSEKVQEVSGNQETMKEALRTTSGNVEEVSVSQRRMDERLVSLSASLALSNAKLQEVTEVQDTLHDKFGKFQDDFMQNAMDSQAAIGKVQQASLIVQEVAASNRTLQEDFDKLKDAMAKEFTSTQQTAGKVLLASRQIQQVTDRQGDMLKSLERIENTSSDTNSKLKAAKEKVEEVRDRQGDMLKSFKQIERTSNDTNSKLTAAKKKVEEVADSQLLKCGKPCAASWCQGKCAKPVYQLHDEKECACEKQGCTEYCSLCDSEEANVCCSRIHLHKYHDCGQQHRCKESCNEQGICALAPIVRKATHPGCKQVGLNGLKLRCNMFCPIGQIKHDGSHSCGKQHTCNRCCPLCGYYCQLQKGHWVLPRCKGIHGPAKHVPTGATIINGQGKWIKLDTMLQCEKLCQAAGRGHTHIVKCTCKREQRANGETVLKPQNGRKHKGDNSNNEDIATHSEFWNSLSPSFADPVAASEKHQFHLCGVTCSVCESRGIKTFCTETVMHFMERPYKGTGHHEFGHTFPDSCGEHRCEEECMKIHGSWVFKRRCQCGRRCGRVKGHSGECDCLYGF